MKKKLLKIALILSVISISNEVSAQWAIGLRGGWTATTISRYDGGRMDESYSAGPGLEFGIAGSYAFNSWLAVEANLSFMQRSHRMDRNLNYLDPVYTEHRNTYLMLPVMGDFSFGGETLRGHLLAGGYAGYWLSERRKGTTYWMTDYNVYFEPFDETREFTDEDLRFNAGLLLGIGLSYSIESRWEIGVNARYYYDLTSHHNGDFNLADPRYLNTLAINLNINYNL